MELSKLVCYQSNKIRLSEIKKNRINIVPFVGAGISIGCGLYSWSELIGKLASDYLTTEQIFMLEQKGDFLDYAEEIVNASGNSDIIMRRIREILSEAKIKLTVLPHLIVTAFSPLIITTNYDAILEQASNKENNPLTPLLPCLTGQVNEAIQLNSKCLLKIHGSLEESQSFVFTKSQYQRFYGKKGNRKGRVLPQFLKNIFSARKVLFLGCSLEQDQTLEILEECIQNNRSISHYAIIEMPSDPILRIKRNQQLAKLGIEPIYYPEGEHDSVEKLLSFLAEDNIFISSLRGILADCLNQSEAELLDILMAFVKSSFYKTALEYPQLLDLEQLKQSYSALVEKELKNGRKTSDTIESVCKEAFAIYVKIGCMLHREEATAFFFEQLHCAGLQETCITDLLERRWSFERNTELMISKDLSWIQQLSDASIHELSEHLLNKLQYRNGMTFSALQPEYQKAKYLITYASNRIDYRTRILLMNCLGAISHYFCDTDAGIALLRECIAELTNYREKNQSDMLFLAKCYGNLALNLALTCNDVETVLDACREDLRLKYKYGESASLCARSQSFYATVLKEYNPFQAIDAYLESEKIKNKLISTKNTVEQQRELTASWATTVFNIGLLAKDLELYSIAYQIVCFANSIRFSTVDYCNRDYCSSLNVVAELELFVQRKDNIEEIIHGIQSRVDLPVGFAETKAHTWYICALYFYRKEDYTTAKKYLIKCRNASEEDGALYDFWQQIRAKMLYGDILAAENWEEATLLYYALINDICTQYSEDNVYLIPLYRRLAYKASGDNCTVNRDIQEFTRLSEMYSSELATIEQKFRSFIREREIPEL